MYMLDFVCVVQMFNTSTYFKVEGWAHFRLQLVAMAVVTSTPTAGREQPAAAEASLDGPWTGPEECLERDQVDLSRHFSKNKIHKFISL